MYKNMHQEYLDTEVLTADPIKLVQLLYRGALDAIAGARRALAAGDIATRSRLISKANAIITELAFSLDHSKAPEFCRNLVELYDYMLRRLIEANAKQIEAPLVEIENLLGGILEAWAQAARQQEKEQISYAAPAYTGETGAHYQQVSYAY
jgi:flagellar protein FliS